MGRFFVRIELHNETNYDKLHEEMEKRGFSRTIVGSKKRHLPTGTYTILSEESCHDVRDSAHGAAKAVNKSADVLAVKAGDWAGYLPEA